ncbi:MAG: hypothetical protein GXC94_12785 [Comamonadaceae bacterium]|nr:hypothetical protein [Comamonadaceae bacterium]
MRIADADAGALQQPPCRATARGQVRAYRGRTAQHQYHGVGGRCELHQATANQAGGADLSEGVGHAARVAEGEKPGPDGSPHRHGINLLPFTAPARANSV